MYGVQDFPGKGELANALKVFKVPCIDHEQCRLALQGASLGVLHYEEGVRHTVMSPQERDHSPVVEMVLDVLEAYLAWAQESELQTAHFKLGSHLLDSAESLLRRSLASPEAVADHDYHQRLDQLLVHLKLLASPYGSYQPRGRWAADAEAAAREDHERMMNFVFENWERVIVDVHQGTVLSKRRSERPALPTPTGIECMRRLIALKAELSPFVLAEISPAQLPAK